MNTIVPNLWFEKDAEEAAKFYVSVFSEAGKTDSAILSITRYGESSAEVANMPVGSVLTVEFKLDGNKFIALNGGPAFKFTPAVSFMVECETQEEVDYFWKALSAGGREDQCGWLQDKYGVSWQIVPKYLNLVILDPDEAKVERVMEAMLKMKKLDIKGLKEAANEA